jgi:hypothetical protein
LSAIHFDWHGHSAAAANGFFVCWDWPRLWLDTDQLITSAAPFFGPLENLSTRERLVLTVEKRQSQKKYFLGKPILQMSREPSPSIHK